jgi:UDP-N-acetylmuramate--alanine ligase
MQKLRIGVLMGGKSIEHEISFNSGRTVCDHLDTSRYEILPLFQAVAGDLYILPWHFLHRGKTTDFTHRLISEAQKVSWDDLKLLVDFIYIALHGKYGEDGTVQGILEILSIPYLGSGIFGSAAGINKIAQKILLTMHSISVAPGIVLDPYHIKNFHTNSAYILNYLEKESLVFPLVVKPSTEGSSLGLSIVETWDALPIALEKACFINPKKVQPVLVEQKIEGMEFSCILLANYLTDSWTPLPPTEIVPDSQVKFYDYEQKYMPGRSTEFTPARCDNMLLAQIQKTCVSVAEILNFSTLARVDGIVTSDGKIIIIDPNSLAGMAPSSFLFKEAAELNMSHTEVINHLIETELYYYGLLNHSLIYHEKRAEVVPKKKLRIAVLFGGNTNEKEISLESGRNVLYKLSPLKYEGVPIFVDSKMNLFVINQKLLVRSSTKEIEQLLVCEMRTEWSALATLADFVFIALHGGLGENGGVQGMLEMLEIPYNGSSIFASALCMDKYKTNQFLKHSGLDVPNSRLVHKKEWLSGKTEIIEEIINIFSLPCIIKPHDDGCSVLVQKVCNENDMIYALDAIFLQNKEYALIEEYIRGMELTVGVIGNQDPYALVPSHVVCAKDILSIEEKFLPGAGENQTPALLPEEAIHFIKKTVTHAYKLLGCKGYARIDCFYQTAHESATNKEKLIFIECNTLPGMTPATCIFHQAAEEGLKPMEFIDTIIELGMQEHSKDASVYISTS